MTETRSPFTAALVDTLAREENTMIISTPYFTDARGTRINHSHCAHSATPKGRRNCRKAVQEIISQIAKNAK